MEIHDGKAVEGEAGRRSVLSRTSYNISSVAVEIVARMCQAASNFVTTDKMRKGAPVSLTDEQFQEPFYVISVNNK